MPHVLSHDSQDIRSHAPLAIRLQVFLHKSLSVDPSSQLRRPATLASQSLAIAFVRLQDSSAGSAKSPRTSYTSTPTQAPSDRQENDVPVSGGLQIMWGLFPSGIHIMRLHSACLRVEK